MSARPMYVDGRGSEVRGGGVEPWVLAQKTKFKKVHAMVTRSGHRRSEYCFAPCVDGLTIRIKWVLSTTV